MKTAAKKTPHQIMTDWYDAHEAAMEAVRAFTARFGPPSLPCGYAWISIRPARGPLVTRLKKFGIGAYNSYSRAYEVSISLFGQSLAHKEAYAERFCEVLRERGYEAYAGSRMD